MIYNDTWMMLLKIVAETNKDSILRLMIYYVANDDEPHTREDTRKATGLDNKTIKVVREILEDYGFITVTKEGKRFKVTVENPISVSNIGEVPIISYILNKFNSRYKDNISYFPDNQEVSSDFTVEDIEADDDWNRVKPILDKYFKPYQYHPQHLVTRKKYFTPLVKLITDPEVDFDAYCKWYRVNKYPRYKFNYGMFLTPGMITEYRNTLEGDEDSRYTNTSKMHESDSFKKSVEESQDFLDEIAREVDET